MRIPAIVSPLFFGTALQSSARGLQEESAVADLPVRRNIFINQAGYLPQGAKYFAVEGLEEGAPGTFSLIDVDLQSPDSRVFSGELQRVSGDFGSYHVGSFSQWTVPGWYVLEVKTRGQASFSSYTFRIGEDVYDDAIDKGVCYHAVQRCGPSSTGYNTPCHLDDAIRDDNNEFLDLVGGWHNSTDLLKWSGASLMSMHGLLNVGALTRNAGLRARIFEEIRWGNLYFHKLQDPSGYIYSHGVGGDAPQEGNHWTDNIRGTADDRRAVTRVADMGDQHAFIWAQALVAQVYGGLDPDYASLCLDRARRCFEWVTGSEGAQKHQTTYYSIGTGISAGVQMFRATKETEYEQYAVEMAERFMALQEREWVGNQQQVRGFFYSNPDRKEGVCIGVCEPLVLVAFCELLDAFPEHSKAQSWRQALEMHCRDYVQVMASRNAFGLVPRGVCLDEPQKPHIYGSGGIPRNRKIGDLGYRYFATASGGARNCYHAGLAVALFKASRLLGQPEQGILAQRQLDWILGANPFGVSFMVAVGHVNPPEYIYTGFQPRTPWIPGATMQGVFADNYDRPDLMPGHFCSCEYWSVHTSFLIWGLAEAKVYNTTAE